MDQAKATEIVQSLTASDVLKAYSGKPGCACGCNGKYYTSPDNRKASDEDDGYACSDDQVQLKQVNRIMRQVQWASRHDTFEANIDRVDRATVCWNVADDLQYVTATVRPSRVYTIYLTKEARRSRGVEKGYGL